VSRSPSLSFTPFYIYINRNLGQIVRLVARLFFYAVAWKNTPARRNIIIVDGRALTNALISLRVPIHPRKPFHEDNSTGRHRRAPDIFRSLVRCCLTRWRSFHLTKHRPLGATRNAPVRTRWFPTAFHPSPSLRRIFENLSRPNTFRSVFFSGVRALRILTTERPRVWIDDDLIND